MGTPVPATGSRSAGAIQRTGSMLLFCLGLAAIAVIIGFGLLRAVAGDTTASDSSYRTLMAQSAARMGLAHATEQIVNGYSNPVALAVGAPTTITFLDAPYRAPFVSSYRPNILIGADSNLALQDNDVRNENHIFAPLVSGLDNKRMACHKQGILIYDSRGRYIEPDYYNTTRLAPATPPPKPAGWPVSYPGSVWSQAVTPTLFLDPAAAVPERSDGLFLDRGFCRISTGSVTNDRITARYRLRYAIGVTDLSGHLLANPMADPNLDWSDAANDYRQPPGWLQQAEQGWYNLTSMFPPEPNNTNAGHDNNPAFFPARWGQVFLGRGNAQNFDRSPVGGFPVTFPMMFRRPDAYWGFYANRGERQTSPGPPGLSNAPLPYPVATLYAHMGGTSANPAGGQPLVAGYNAGADYRPYVSTMFGPQQSWYNMYSSIQGVAPRGTGGGGGTNSDGVGWGDIQAFTMTQVLPTPFGRGVVATPAPTKWFEGKLDCPWNVNLLTAPPQVIQAMLVGYLPPHARIFRNTAAGMSCDTYIFGLPVQSTYGGLYGNRPNPPLGIQPVDLKCGHDLRTALGGNQAFSEYPAPTDGFGNINFLVTDMRQASQRYPGKLWNHSYAFPVPLTTLGDPVPAGIDDAIGDDDLGEFIDVATTNKVGRCSHVGGEFFPELSSTFQNSWLSGTVTATHPTGWKSYWWDIFHAMSTTIATARAAWVQYPTEYFDPAAVGSFTPATLRDPALFDSIEKIDRFFLNQLGENFATPGDGVPLNPVICDYDLGFSASGPRGGRQKFTRSAAAVSHTIRTLVTGDLITCVGATSAERGAVMERVLNDVRLSFFGSSPLYSASFHPLNFDGDDKVMCSGYDRNPGATANEIDKGIDRYVAVGTGVAQGPVPTNWFSSTGCFFVGQSHFYRITVRGELFDNVSNMSVTQATLDAVLVVDPDGTGSHSKDHFLFQRWMYDRYTGMLSMHDD